MKKVCLFTVLVVLCCKAFILQAQSYSNLSPDKSLMEYTIQNISTEQGLPSVSVNDIIQDSVGYLYLATYGGLCRFDGYSIRTYSSRFYPALKSMGLQKLCQDKQKNIWIGTNGGITLFKDEQLYELPALKKLDNNVVASLLCDKKGQMWIGTQGVGLFMYADSVLHDFSKQSGLQNKIITYIYQDAQENIWIATENEYLVKFDGQQFIQQSLSSFVSGIFDIYETPGHLFLATGKGLYDLFEQKFIKISDHDVFTTDIEFDQQQNLWIATQTGLYRYNLVTKQTSSVTEYDGLPDDILNEIMFDNEGNFWAATFRQGIFKMSDGAITSILHPASSKQKEVSAVAQINDTLMWIGSDAGFISQITNNKSYLFPLQQYIPQERIKSIYVQTPTITWLCTYAGLLKVQNNKVIKYNFSQQKIDNFVRSCVSDSAGNIWFGTRQSGLIKLNEQGDVTKYDITNGLSNNYVMSITKGHNQTLIVATKKGLNFIKDAKIIKHIGIEHGLSDNLVFNTYHDQHGDIWAATNKGISRVTSDTVFVYSSRSGLLQDVVFDIVEDDFGYFWLPSSIGIMRISRKDCDAYMQRTLKQINCDLFDKSDGMKTSECMGAAYSIKDTRGCLWIPTVNGVAMINPARVNSNLRPPKVIIENTQIDYSQTVINDTITLEADVQRIVINYTAFNYYSPDKIKFKYQLYPFEKDISQPSAERTVSYTYMPPGQYSFRVWACNENDVWTLQPANITIIKKAHFYETRIFYISTFIIIILLIWLVVRWRINTVRQRNQNLEKAIKERTLEVVQQKNLLEQQNMAIQAQADQLKLANNDTLRVNNELYRQKTELENTLHTLQTTQKKLVEAEKMASLGNLVAGVAHEINTPVGVAITSISTVINDIKELVEKYEKNDMSASDFESYVQMFYDGNTLALKNLERTAGLVRSFKQISLDQHSEQERKFNLNDYLHDILASINPEFKHTQIKIVIDCPLDLVINSYPGAFAQIFTNLLTNSKRHGFRNRNEGQINIVVKRENEKLLMEYTDNGHGIPEKVLPRIFDPFFTTDMQGGTGLGLNILYNLVTQKLGGEIKCESREGEGVKFLMTL